MAVALGDGHGTAEAAALVDEATALLCLPPAQVSKDSSVASRSGGSGDGGGGGSMSSFQRRADVQVAVVRECGASVWSASASAALEFPGVAPALLGAVSLGRRLIDPLAELVRLDPSR